MAREALDSLEEPFRTHAKAVAIKVEDFADDETLATMKIENPYERRGCIPASR
jgi:predicted Zn-dependent protease with MMP-like domain